MDEVDLEIEKLRKEINRLKITTAKKISILDTKLTQLETEKQALVTPGSPAPRHFTGHFDRFGKKVYVGDRVGFLTTGKFDSSEGHVSGYTRTRIFATDYCNREIPRASKNVKIIE